MKSNLSIQNPVSNKLKNVFKYVCVRRNVKLLIPIIAVMSIFLSGFSFAENEINQSAESEKQAVLADEGCANYGVYVASSANEMERHAADEAVQYLTQVTGASFELSADDSKPKGPMIIVGDNKRTRELIPNLAQQQLGEDGFIIRKVKEDIVISGNTSRGTMYGVNYFLDYYVGVRWYAPDFTYVPDKPKLKVSVDNDVQIPRFEYREMYANDGNNEQFRAHNLLNGKYRDRQQQSVPALDSWSNFWPSEVHNFYSLVPNPELKTGGQLLAMNEDVRSIATTNIITKIKEKISIGKDSSYGFSQQDTVWQADPASSAFAAAHGNTLAAPILDMVSDVANRVKQVIPNARIGTLAYMFTYQPPTGMTVPDNVVVTVAPLDKDHGQPINSAKNKFFGDGLKGWANLTDNIVFWDYITNFSNGGYYQPYPNLGAMSETIQYLAQFPSVKGYFGQGMHNLAGPQGSELMDLRTWIGSRLLWNPNQDYKALIDEFVNAYYGDAAPMVSDYIDLIHRSYNETNSTLNINTLATAPYLNFETMRQADQLFEQAAVTASNNPVMLNHVQKLRISVDLIVLLRYDEFMLEASNRNVTWNFDIEARKQRFKTYTEGVGFYAIGLPMKNLYDLMDIPKVAPTIPDLVKDLPASSWQDIQELNFKLTGGAKLVPDSKASNSVAASVYGTVNSWAIQINSEVLPREGKWKLYANVRVDPGTGVAGNTAFTYGIYRGSTPGYSGSVDYSIVSDGEYHLIEVPAIYEYNPALTANYLWFYPPRNSVIKTLYVDRIIAVRQ